MQLKRYRARMLFNYTVEQLWDILEGDFILVFDDGEELVTDARATLYSSYAWEFHRRYPQTQLLAKHHVKSFLGDGRMGSNTHLTLLGNVMWSVYDTHVVGGTATLPTHVMPEIKFRESLAKLIYETTNLMYNDLSYRLEEYVVSLDITHVIEVLNHPRIKAVNANVKPTEESIADAYAVGKDVLLNGVDLPRNPTSLAARSGLVSMGQLYQCLLPRGFLTDIDSNQFPKPIMVGFAEGITSIVDSGMETRSAAKSLDFAKAPLQDAEYFARRLQLVSQIITTLHHGDCGSTNYLSWDVREGELAQLEGKYYMEDDGNLRVIKRSKKHLIGRTLLLRSAIHCAHRDQYGICSTCFGDLAFSVPSHSNIGHMCCTSLTQKSSQIVLSVKHHDGTAQIEAITLSAEDMKYLRTYSDKNSYLLSEELKNGKVTLVIAASQGANLTDIRRAKQIEDLSITRVTELDYIGIEVTREINGVTRTISKAMKVNIGSRRLASLTMHALRHLHKAGWVPDDDGNYRIDMTGWDYTKPILTLPPRHANMSDHSKDIAMMLESSVKNMEARDTVVRPEALLKEFHGVVNDKLNVNLAVNEVVLYGAMIVSAADCDYSLPKPWTSDSLGVMENTMKYRSMGPLFAYEGHRDNIVAPASYLKTNRPDHPMDYLLTPAELVAHEESLMGMVMSY